MKEKPIRLNRTLSLDRETITRLNEEQLSEVAGGSFPLGWTITCHNPDPEPEQEGEVANFCIACSNTGG